jgi:hypothetical protein
VPSARDRLRCNCSCWAPPTVWRRQGPTERERSKGHRRHSVQGNGRCHDIHMDDPVRPHSHPVLSATQGASPWTFASCRRFLCRSVPGGRPGPGARLGTAKAGRRPAASMTRGRRPHAATYAGRAPKGGPVHKTRLFRWLRCGRLHPEASGPGLAQPAGAGRGRPRRRYYVIRLVHQVRTCVGGGRRPAPISPTRGTNDAGVGGARRTASLDHWPYATVRVVGGRKVAWERVGKQARRP